jgi:hypothetical protein
MKTNMGAADRIIRIIIAAILIVLYVTGAISGTLGLVLITFSAIFVLTSFVGFCPLYTVFNIKTLGKNAAYRK